jgi:hypothetical protein
MATVLTHPAVPLAISLGLGRDVVPTPLLIAGIAVSALPDLNALAFRNRNVITQYGVLSEVHIASPKIMTNDLFNQNASMGPAR